MDNEKNDNGSKLVSCLDRKSIKNTHSFFNYLLMWSDNDQLAILTTMGISSANFIKPRIDKIILDQ